MSTSPRNLSRTLDAQADVFARLLGRRPDQPDDAWRRAVTLAEGLFPHQVEGVAFLAGGVGVTCSCPGFEYRGQCKHARDIKSALAAGQAVPPAYRVAGASGELS